MPPVLLRRTYLCNVSQRNSRSMSETLPSLSRRRPIMDERIGLTCRQMYAGGWEGLTQRGPFLRWCSQMRDHPNKDQSSAVGPVQAYRIAGKSVSAIRE